MTSWGHDVIIWNAQGGGMGTFSMLLRILLGAFVPIFSFVLIFSNLLPIYTGLILQHHAKRLSLIILKLDLVCRKRQSQTAHRRAGRLFLSLSYRLLLVFTTKLTKPMEADRTRLGDMILETQVRRVWPKKNIFLGFFFGGEGNLFPRLLRLWLGPRPPPTKSGPDTHCCRTWPLRQLRLSCLCYKL